MTIRNRDRTRSSQASGLLRPGTRWFPVLAVAAALAAAWPGAADAQPSPQGGAPASAAVDSRWLPWLGCWQLVEETAPLPESADGLSAFADRVLVCVTPAAPPAAATDVVVTTLANDEPVLVETLSADGLEHPVDQTECRGRRRIAWSDDGRRLFTRAALTCGGNDARRLSGVGLILDNWNWLDLKLVEAGERAAVTVRRYRRAGDVATLSAAGPTLTPDLLVQARTASVMAAQADLTIEAVIEAGNEVEPAVLEAMLVETGAAFDLDGRTLLRLDDAGVPGEITDMLVALSFPEDFQVRRSAPTGGGGGGFLSSWSGYGYDSWYPYYAAPFGYYYGWSPYRSLYGWGDYYYLGAPYYGGPGSSDFRDSPERRRGRIYEGYGYTRAARPRDDGGGRRAQPRGTPVATASGGGSSGGGSSMGSSGGGGGGRRGVSTSGWSTGGGSSSGRVATPRSSGGGSSGGGSSGGSSGGGSSGGRTATPRDP